MVFSNSIFLFVFLPITLIVYYNPFVKNMGFRNFWLLITSLFFYAWGEPVYVLLMICSIVVNWALGLWEAGNKKTKKGKLIVLIACVYNLGQLFVFKYLGWISGIFGNTTVFSKIMLPIGISFYTFQALSYVIDVYRGKDEAQKSLFNVGLYIAFFPQLVAGPIVRYGSIAEQINNRSHSFSLFTDGVWRFILGLSKKAILANQLAIVAEKAFNSSPGELSVVFAWAGVFAFMLQIYFDFSGYSDMAIGLGKMFGFEFRENFNYPYVSKSVSEYWRRWHISLGEWFRDYVYYPLSLGPAIKIRKYLSEKASKKTAAFVANTFVLFVVWMTTGIWHGANWTFVIWGFIQFVCLFIEQHRKPLKNKKLGAVLGFVSTYLIVLLTKVIFNAKNMSAAIAYYGSMFGLNSNAFCDNYGLYWIGQYKFYLIAGFILSFPVLEKITKFCEGKRIQPIWGAIQTIAMCVMLILSMAYAIGGSYSPFIYFNF